MVGGMMVGGMDDEKGELHVWLVSFPDYFHPVRKQKSSLGMRLDYGTGGSQLHKH